MSDEKRLSCLLGRFCINLNGNRQTNRRLYTKKIEVNGISRRSNQFDLAATVVAKLTVNDRRWIDLNPKPRNSVQVKGYLAPKR